MKKALANMPEVVPVYDQEGFVRFYYNLTPMEILLRNAERDYEEEKRWVQDLDENLAKSGNLFVAEEMKDARCEMLMKHNKLRALRAGKRDVASIDEHTLERALADFRQIERMRGVQQIYAMGNELCVYIRAMYPYKKTLYHLGDYKIRLSKKGILVEIVHGKSMYARYDEGVLAFNMGRHECEAKRYLLEGRIVEALVLTVESLHYVNTDDRESVPNRYESVRKLTRGEKKMIKIRL